MQKLFVYYIFVSHQLVIGTSITNILPLTMHHLIFTETTMRPNIEKRIMNQLRITNKVIQT